MLFNKISTCIALVATTVQFTEATWIKPSGLPGCASSNERSDAIKQAFLGSYNEYRQYAFGHDELLPVSKSFSDSRNKWGATIVDALDTMIIMGLDKEYKEALNFVSKIDFSKSPSVSKGFETNIRYLGGLLAANDLRPNKMLVQKAIEVAEITLLPLFVDSVTPDGKKVKVPLTYLNVNNGTPENANSINLAEWGTYTMEFTRLSQVTGNATYEKLANDLNNAGIAQETKIPGLFPTSWAVQPFAPIEKSTITVSGGGDSFYEYLIKNYILQTDKTEKHKEIWEQSVQSIEKYMLSPTKQDPAIQFVGQLANGKVYYNSQELICFWPGNILLGITQMEDQAKKDKFRKFADVFFKSCIETWKKTETGVAPESWKWTPANDALDKQLSQVYSQKDKRDASRTFTIDNGIYDLRPETIESVFYYYRLTGDKRFQELGWSLFRAINKYARVEKAFSRIDNVDEVPVKLQDFQESFFFAETLKYLYLMFTDKECISLNDYVFNTEAHPFKLSVPIEYQS